MSEISEKGRKLLDQYWDAVIGYERMSGYINYEKAEDMALDELSSYIAALEEFKAIVEECGFKVLTEPPVLNHPERKILQGHGVMYVPTPPKVQE